MASKKKKIAKRKKNLHELQGLLTSIDNAINGETLYPIIKRRLIKIRAKIDTLYSDQIAIDCYRDGRIV